MVLKSTRIKTRNEQIKVQYNQSDLFQMRNGKQKSGSTAPLPRRPEYSQPPYSSLNNQPIQNQPE